MIKNLQVKLSSLDPENGLILISLDHDDEHILIKSRDGGLGVSVKLSELNDAVGAINRFLIDNPRRVE